MQRRFPLTEQYLKELVDTFRKYDADKSDSLDITEMRAMLRDVESKMTHLPAVSFHLAIYIRAAKGVIVLTISLAMKRRHR